MAYRRERTRGRGSVASDTAATAGVTGADAASSLVSGSSPPLIACMFFIRFWAIFVSFLITHVSLFLGYGKTVTYSYR